MHVSIRGPLLLKFLSRSFVSGLSANLLPLAFFGCGNDAKAVILRIIYVTVCMYTAKNQAQ